MHKQDRFALMALAGVALVALPGLAQVACTPAQVRRAKTALEVNVCVSGVTLRHIDAGDDLKDPLVSARIAAEVVDECTPLVVKAPAEG